MLHYSFDDQRIFLAMSETRFRQFMHSILFYISVLILVVLTTGILVIFAFSAVNHLEPSLNQTDSLGGPDLSMSNELANSSKDANESHP